MPPPPPPPPLSIWGMVAVPPHFPLYFSPSQGAAAEAGDNSSSNSSSSGSSIGGGGGGGGGGGSGGGGGGGGGSGSNALGVVGGGASMGVGAFGPSPQSENTLDALPTRALVSPEEALLTHGFHLQSSLLLVPGLERGSGRKKGVVRLR